MAGVSVLIWVSKSQAKIKILLDIILGILGIGSSEMCEFCALGISVYGII